LPPSPFCWKCRAQDVEWIDHDRRRNDLFVHGHSPRGHPAGAATRCRLSPRVRRASGHERGAALIGNVVDCEPEAVRIGAPVTLDWYDVRDGTTIPVFRL